MGNYLSLVMAIRHFVVGLGGLGIAMLTMHHGTVLGVSCCLRAMVHCQPRYYQASNATSEWPIIVFCSALRTIELKKCYFLSPNLVSNSGIFYSTSYLTQS